MYFQGRYCSILDHAFGLFWFQFLCVRALSQALSDAMFVPSLIVTVAHYCVHSTYLKGAVPLERIAVTFASDYEIIAFLGIRD